MLVRDPGGEDAQSLVRGRAGFGGEDDELLIRVASELSVSQSRVISPTTGSRPAKAAGMRVIAIPNRTFDRLRTLLVEADVVRPRSPS